MLLPVVRTALCIVVTLVATGGLVVVPGAPPARASVCPPSSPPTGAPLPAGVMATEIHWTAVTRWTTYGSDATVQGQVVTDEGALGGVEVHLWARPSGGEWTHHSTTTSDDDSGVFSFGCVVPERSTDYRVEYHGDLAHAATRAQRTIEVARALDDLMRRTGATSWALHGRVSPAYAGRVLLQHRAGHGSWSTVERRRVSDSRWRFDVDVSRLRGTHAWRAVVPPGDGFRRALGRTWRITIR